MVSADRGGTVVGCLLISHYMKKSEESECNLKTFCFLPHIFPAKEVEFMIIPSYIFEAGKFAEVCVSLAQGHAKEHLEQCPSLSNSASHFSLNM